MLLSIIQKSRIILFVAIFFVPVHAIQFNISGPAGSGTFGSSVTALSNGNIVITDPGYDAPGPVANVGAVYLYNGISGAVISTMTGSTANDRVGSDGVTVLANGNYVVRSSFWSGTAAGVGAVTLCSGTTGCSGVVTTANSLVGSTLNDNVGSTGVTAMANGNYVVRSLFWNGTAADVGAVTLCSGTTGCSGMVVSAANSLVGSTLDDNVGGQGLTVLANGNYVVRSSSWDLAAANVGAVTWCSGTTGCSGVVSSANSLVGSTLSDTVGSVTALTNGNYVVFSPNWDGTASNVGAVTWCNGTTGRSGVVSAVNSLVGSLANDNVGGSNVTALTNGNYVVRSPNWDGTAADVGAVTWCSGTTGCSGVVSPANSMVGSTLNDNIGASAFSALNNGNYVIGSASWDGAAADVGAVTWCNGTTGCSGTVSSANSLVGSTAGDFVGNNPIAALANGNYVVRSPIWAGTAAGVGAVTFCSGTTGCSGAVSAANSLVGSTLNDNVGSGTVRALTNGNYVVGSPLWNGTAADVGAATWCSGTTGCTSMAVSAANSLVGSTTSDIVGNGVTALTNGNYVVSSFNWDGTAADVGAASWCSGTTGCSGMTVSAANSLVGSTANDFISGNSITALANGNYIVRTNSWDNPAGPVANAGAVSYGDGTVGTVGTVAAANSILGTAVNGGDNMSVAFNNANQILVVGRSDSNIVTFFLTPTTTPAISGIVTYGNSIGAPNPRYVSNVMINSTAGSPAVSTTTGAPGPIAGQYTLTGFGAGSYTVSLSKTTGQNSITSFDAGRIAQHVAGTLLLTTNNQKVSADVSNNGVVSSFDAAQIATFVATGSSPGIAGQWRFFLPPGPTFPIGASPTSRTYPSVTSNITGDDYIGLLIGEVTGNWAPTAARPGGSSEGVSSPHISNGSSAPSGALTYVRATDTLRDSQGPERGVTITLPNIEAASDKDIIVPVNVQGAADKGIISYEFDLRYDPSVIQPLPDPADVAGTVSRGLSVVTNATEPGLLRVVVYGAMPIDENGVLLNLRFTAVGAAGSVSPLTFERIMFNEGDPPVTAVDGMLELSKW